MTRDFSTAIECGIQHRPEKGYWLITLGISPDFCVNGMDTWAYPQAHAIIDDYGSLLIISNFR